jgi:hypothetical protein
MFPYITPKSVLLLALAASMIAEQLPATQMNISGHPPKIRFSQTHSQKIHINIRKWNSIICQHNAKPIVSYL